MNGARCGSRTELRYHLPAQGLSHKGKPRFLVQTKLPSKESHRYLDMDPKPLGGTKTKQTERENKQNSEAQKEGPDPGGKTADNKIESKNPSLELPGYSSNKQRQNHKAKT